MTEIGANFSASTRLLQDMHTRAKDGKIDETDVAALTKTATEDASGLTEDEKQMIASLHEGGASAEVVAKNIAALQALKTKEVTPPAPAQETSPEAAETTEITNVTAHEADANQVDFSGLTLTTEKKNFLSKASFGLFGGKTEYSHQVSIADGNIPTIANPAGIQTDEARQQVERGNLIGMMAPLENELNQALTPSADNDVRKRYAEILSKEKGETVSADSPEVTARIQQLKTKMETFKNTPSSNWTNSTDLTQLMESYNQRPAPQGSALNAGYMASLLGSFYNAADARDSAATVKENLTTGNIQTPATLNELNQKLSSSDQAAREQLSQSVEKTTQFLDKLKELKSSNPSAYQALLNGADESAIELLHTQVAEMKKHLDSNQPISQAQISQGNMMWATMHRMQTGLKFPADVDVQSLQTLAADLEKDCQS